MNITDAALYLNVSTEYVEKLLKKRTLIRSEDGLVDANVLALYRAYDDARRRAITDQMARESEALGI